MDLKDKGFTLIELMVAIVVLGVGLLALAQMQIAAINGNTTANNMTVATTLAQDEIERLRRLDFNAADLADSNADNNSNLSNPANSGAVDHSNPNNPIDERGGTTGLRRYSRFWNISDNNPTPGVKTLVALVYWGPIEGNGLPRHRVAITTNIGQP